MIMSTARIAGNAAIVGMGTFVGYKFLEEDNDTGVSKPKKMELLLGLQKRLPAFFSRNNLSISYEL
jgi:hypothetical protein